MEASQQLLVPNRNRQATQAELDHAATILRSLGNEVLASRVENSNRLDPDDCSILVVTDFDAVDDVPVVLIPPGTHEIPSGLLETERYLIGLSLESRNYPTLILKGESSGAINSDTSEETSLQICRSFSYLSRVILDAPQPTVVEVYFDDKQFSDVFFEVEWRRNIDALNIRAYTFYNGWDWVRTAYGSYYRGRNCLEKGLDAVHQGVMNAIDGTFRPLVRLGEKIDQMLGVK